MPKLVGTVKPHDKFDIGWCHAGNDAYAHWYRSHKLSHLAISHCAKAKLKRELVVRKPIVKCEYCAIVEQARNSLDVKHD